MKKRQATLAAGLLSLGLLLPCPAPAEPLGMPTLSTPAVEQASKQANELFEKAYEAKLERNPTDLSREGSKKFYDRWDDLSPQEQQAQFLVSQAWAKRIATALEGKVLDEETTLSVQLFKYNAERQRRWQPYTEYDYPVNQMFGLHAEVPAFLINVHQIDSTQEAQSYVLRLERLPKLVSQLNKGLVRREKSGILPPKFVFDYVIGDIDNLLSGYPITDDPSKPHPIYKDFEGKIKALKLEPAAEQELLSDGRAAIKGPFREAYASLRAVVADQRSRATTEDGCWKFPDGDKYYAEALARTTTTDMTAEEIHQLGLSEVERIHAEMREIMKKVGFEGSLAEFFLFMREDEQFYYPNTAEGKKAYLTRAVKTVDDMKAQLDQLFLTKPKADLVVKAVEPFREKSAGKAFYQTPAMDGSRPGYYYANLYDMDSMPSYQMEALAYHEGIPGHHMQLSIAQELEGLPRFRRTGFYTAYIEGWGLYCEKLPKEYGFYQDPYSDFGRLAMELWRACRLVVDTGIHHKRWTREQGVDYYRTNTPNSLDDCQKMVDRHIVMPGQATAYKVGMNEILRLREKARAELGERFDIREFHDVVLTHGAVPLAVLEDLVERYIDSKG